MYGNSKKDIISNIAGVFTNVRQRSAMNPFLWIIGILGIVFVFSFSIPNVPVWIMIVSGVLLTIALLSVLGVGIYFVCVAPNNLRSDEYQTKYDMLMFMARSQTKPNRVIETDLTYNPELKEKE